MQEYNRYRGLFFYGNTVGSGDRPHAGVVTEAPEEEASKWITPLTRAELHRVYRFFHVGTVKKYPGDDLPTQEYPLQATAERLYRKYERVFKDEPYPRNASCLRCYRLDGPNPHKTHPSVNIKRWDTDIGPCSWDESRRRHSGSFSPYVEFELGRAFLKDLHQSFPRLFEQPRSKFRIRQVIRRWARWRCVDRETANEACELAYNWFESEVHAGRISQEQIDTYNAA